MKSYDFPQYSPTGYNEPTTVILERVTHFYPIGYNSSGTVLVLDTGQEVRTSMRQWDVKKLFDE